MKIGLLPHLRLLDGLTGEARYMLSFRMFFKFFKANTCKTYFIMDNFFV